MSKASAMAMATGQPTAATAPPPATPAGQPGVQPAAAPQVQPAPAAGSSLESLLKKETALVNERQRFAKEREEWTPKIKRAEEILAKGQQFEELKSKDPVAALRLIGYDDTQIFNIMASANEPPKDKTPEQIAREETERILKERDDNDAKIRNEAQLKANDAAVKAGIKRMRTDEANVEKFAMINHHGPMAEEVVHETLKEFAKQMRPEDINEDSANQLLGEAMEAVEEWYRGQFEGLVDKQVGLVAKKLEALGWTKAQAQAAAQNIVAENPPATSAPVPQGNRPAATRSVSAVQPTAAAVASARVPETKEQKRMRLEQSLRTGDKSLLRV